MYRHKVSKFCYSRSRRATKVPPARRAKKFFSLIEGSPEGWGIERDVKIASGHGPHTQIYLGVGERAIFSSSIFHAGDYSPSFTSGNSANEVSEIGRSREIPHPRGDPSIVNLYVYIGLTMGIWSGILFVCGE